MKVNPYLSFNGDCEAAFKFYEQCLGARIGGIFRYGGSPLEGQVPADWSDKVMHGNLTFGDQVLQGAGVAAYVEPKGFSFSIQLTDTSEAERIFRELAENGKVMMPIQETFWAERFGMVVDRFGISWLINCGPSEPGPEA